ncbi:MAG TPA: complex I subunit 5 family protein [Gammaproteobacteria bacterium]|nr:complex I subunit 5 family protein [Gammaproteobacteria bacterium]
MSHTSASLLMSLGIGAPMVVLALYATRISCSLALRLAPWAALPALLAAALVPADASLRLPWLMLGADLGLGDSTGRLFLLFTALLWWLAGLFAGDYLSESSGRGRFFVYFLLSMSGNIGLVFSQDVVSFYLFFALMSFASYGLVVHEGTPAALRAGRVYMALVVVGEVALFAAIVFAAADAGSLGFAPVRAALGHAEDRNLVMMLALIGFGIKAGVLGLHVWLPLAHPVAPTPASAVLSGAMINAGLLGFLRLFPLGAAGLAQWGEALMLLGLAAAFYAVAVGLTQRNPKTLLAYSSISQMGILTTALGLGLTSPSTVPSLVPVIGLYALHHALNKGALFLGVGVVGAASGTPRRWIWLLLWLPALALAGAPFTSGMVAKLLLKAEMYHLPSAWGPALQAVLPWSAVATSLLMGRFLLLLKRPRTGYAAAGVPTGLLVPWGILIALVTLLPLYMVGPGSPIWTSASAYVGSTWPLLLAAAALFAATSWRAVAVRRRWVGPGCAGQTSGGGPLSLPAGDLLVVISQTWMPLGEWLLGLAGTTVPRWRTAWLTRVERIATALDPRSAMDQVETTLRRWGTGALCLLILGLLLALAGWMAR